MTKFTHGLFLFLTISLIGSAVEADDRMPAIELAKHIADMPEVGFKYKGQKQLTQEESKHLVDDMALKKTLTEKEKDCPPDQKITEAKAAVVLPKKDDKKDNWQVVFVMKISSASFDDTSAKTHYGKGIGIVRAMIDTDELKAMARAGKLDQKKLDKVLTASGASMNHDPKAAMSYIATLGAKLNENYGDSKAGAFVTSVEQYGRMSKGESVGQCSDIHYAMLRAYKQLTGNKNAKAYLVNFQTGHSVVHTNLVIEEQGQIFTVNYGEVTSVASTSSDPLKQNTSSSSGIAYRIFGEKDENTDKMLAHIDSPMGMFLREVSTGTSSYNPFQNANYSLASVGIAKGDNKHVQVFFGELPGGDLITGVAANIGAASKLPAGFTLESHVSGAIAYSHKKFATETKKSSLHSEVLYINTGLGLVSPKLHLGNFSLQAKTSLTLESGIWLKQLQGEAQMSPFSGDLNIVSHSKVTGEYNTDKVSVVGSLGVEVMPSFATSFPKVTDGSSMEGFDKSLGILPNRTTASIDLTYRPTNKTSLNLGGTYMHTPLGSLGEARAGVGVSNVTVNAYLRGAFDRDQTPGFVPGAVRSVGAMINWCTSEISKKLPVCISAQAQKSLEDSSWQLNTGVGGKF